MSETPDFHTPGGANERDGAIPRFYTRPVQSKYKSNLAGRPIFEDREFVEILVPGDRKTVVDEMVKDEHRRRWPRAYEAFRSGQEAPTEGTPLAEWPGISRSLVEELRFSKVFSVEQLAGLTDDQLAKTIQMGGFALREKAQRFLESAKGSEPMEKLAAENEVLKATLAETNGKLEALTAEVARMSQQRAETAPASPAPQT